MTAEMIQGLGFDGINTDRNELATLMVGASSGWMIVFTLAEGVRAVIQCKRLAPNGRLLGSSLTPAPGSTGRGARGFECAVTAWCPRLSKVERRRKAGRLYALRQYWAAGRASN
jgi:hypothetical protein